MIVLEDCPRCGEVASHVPDAEVERREAMRAKLLAAGVRAPALTYHQCVSMGLGSPVKARPRWLAFLLRLAA